MELSGQATSHEKKSHANYILNDTYEMSLNACQIHSDKMVSSYWPAAADFPKARFKRRLCFLKQKSIKSIK